MVIVRNYLIPLAIVLVAPVLLMAQVAGVDISVSPRTGTIDSTFEILVTVDPSTVDSRPELAESEEFTLIGTSTRSQTFISNGDVSNQYAYAFSLQPNKTGRLELPQILIESRSRMVTLPVGVVDVSQSSSQSELQDDKKIVFQQSVSKLKAYQGEQIRNSFEVLSDEVFRDVEFPAPSFPGFWIESRQKDRSGSRVQGGKRIFYYETVRSLYPISTGILPIDEKEIALKVRNESNRAAFNIKSFPLTLFSSATPRRITLKSNPLEIEVMELPTAPQPAHFWSNEVLVGKTKVRAQFDAAPIDSGDSKTIHITISTLGNVNPIKKIPLESTSQYRVYQEAPQIGYQIEEGLLRMELNLSASIVPKARGNITIPPLKLTYFNPESAKYKTIVTRPFSFVVYGGKTSENTAEDSTLQQPDAEISIEPAVEPTAKPDPILPSYKPATIVDEILQTLSLGMLVFIACLILLLTVVIWLLLPLVRAQRYSQKLKRRIQAARNPSELAHVFEAHIRKMTGIKPNAFKKSELANELQHYIGNRSLLFAIQAFLDSLEQSAFNPTATIDTEQLRTEAEMIIEAWQ